MPVEIYLDRGRGGRGGRIDRPLKNLYGIMYFLRDVEQTWERPGSARIALGKESGMPAASWRWFFANVGCESGTFVC